MQNSDCDKCVTRVLECGHEHFLHSCMDPKDFKCPTLVRATLPCGHEAIQKPCHKDVNEWRCGFPCDARIEPCGHSCIRTCHVNHDPNHLEYICYKTCDRVYQGCSTKTHKCQMYCNQKCPSCVVIVKKKLTQCDHMQYLECSESGDKIACMEPCSKKIASCGHDCKRKCFEPCGGCEEMVIKTVPSCGHEIQIKCAELPKIEDCSGACSKLLPCGHPCTKKCNEVCTSLCCELVEHTKPVFCGHKFKIECYLQNEELPSYSRKLLRFCKESCSAVLECSHKCSGTCGECAQGRIHVTCTEKCGATLICGHECRIPCENVCQPCQLKCSFKCNHSKCTKTCGEVCTKCQETCTRRCKHVECTSKCGDICTVPPCVEPCEKKLSCSDPCVGFCGNPCPPLCRICNAEELSEVFFGHEDELDVRFVLLDECKHVIESGGMEIHCKNDGTKCIKYIKCPKCDTLLTTTQRYSDYIKLAIRDVEIIKRKDTGSFEEIQAKRVELQKKLDEIKVFRSGSVFSPGFDKFVTECDSFLQPSVIVERRQKFDLIIGKTLEAKLTIVQNIGNILQAQELLVVSSTSSVSPLDVAAEDEYLVLVFEEAKDYVEYLFTRLTKQVERITNQEIQDFEREQGRLHRIAQFVNIVKSSTDSENYNALKELLYQPIIYTEIYDKIVKIQLEEFRKKMHVGGLPDQERLEIVRIIGVRKGGWYKCPNGHIYAIGECGGAMEVGKCYECGAQIGGTQHTLLPDNSHAGEMDDSEFPAWSNIANNMINFGLND